MMAPPTPQPWPEFEDRYVARDGSLVDDEAKAATRWAPGLKREILTGRNLRFLPHTAEDIWDADGVVLGRFLAWRKVREMFPAVKDFTDEQKKMIKDAYNSWYCQEPLVKNCTIVWAQGESILNCTNVSGTANSDIAKMTAMTPDWSTFRGR